MRNILLVGRYSFMDIFHSRVMTNVFLVGIALTTLSLMAAEFTLGAPEKIALDFGLGACSLVLVGIALFMGVSLIAKDVENRTLYMLLSRPLERGPFLLGKVLGMEVMLFLNTTLLAFFSLMAFLILGGEFNLLILWSFLFNFIEASILLLVVVNFSLITNTVMSVLYSIVIFLLGHALVETQLLRYVQAHPFLQTLFKMLTFFLPNLHKLNLKNHVLYQSTLPDSFLVNALFYGGLYFLALLFLSIFLFKRKNLD